MEINLLQKPNSLPKRVSDRQKERFVRDLKDYPCTDCGGRFPAVAMDFDHLPGCVKLFTIGRNTCKHSLYNIMEEIKKCELVCANCHRVRTFDRARIKRVAGISAQSIT
jgi:hypothetical protein